MVRKKNKEKNLFFQIIFYPFRNGPSCLALSKGPEHPRQTLL